MHVTITKLVQVLVAALLMVLAACGVQQRPAEPSEPISTAPVDNKIDRAQTEVAKREERDRLSRGDTRDDKRQVKPQSPAVMPQPVMEQEAVIADAAVAGYAMKSRQAVSSFHPAPPGHHWPVQEPLDRENYAAIDSNPIKRVSEDPVSTFSVDVDTGAYANVRRFLRAGSLPRHDAVRVEELINYFDYSYEVPRDRNRPFSVHTEIAPTPWNSKTNLLHVGIQGWKPSGEMPPANLVFLLDVSGSMNSPDKLPLLKGAFKLLVNKLRPEDKVSIAVYAGASGTVLEPTSGSEKHKIIAALDRLSAGGSTNGAAGIRLAYSMAEQAYVKEGVNRVILATDGDFNVGTTNFEALKEMVEEKRKGGIALSTLGFGTGNYNDHLAEQLADVGNGNHAYIDSIAEANKVLGEQMSATLQTIAKDVKIQIEFNPAVIAEYRLIGYENRMLKREDFNNDKIDAGEIGAGHTVTALYEVALVGRGGESVEPLRYGKKNSQRERRSLAGAAELAHLRLRYKAPDGDVSKLIEQPLYVRDMLDDSNKASEAWRFSAAVAGYGQLLRGGDHTRDWQYDDVVRLARSARGDDPHGWRGEFVQLVELAHSLSGTTVGMKE